MSRISSALTGLWRRTHNTNTMTHKTIRYYGTLHTTFSQHAHAPAQPLPTITTAPATSPNSCSRSKPIEPSTKLVTPSAMLETIRRQKGNNQTAHTPSATNPLLDTFGRFHNYLRISLTERCNLRCVYCMPEEGVELTPSTDLLSTPEIQRLLELFVEHGVTKVRFTGGEPTVRKDLLQLIEHAGSLRSKGLDQVCLTTNGLVLSRKLPALVKAGLTHVNISLDTLDEHKFTIMTRRNGGKQVRQAIMDAAGSVTPTATGAQPGLRSVKINCVIMRGLNDNELLDFVALTKDNPLEVRFIEYMPFDGNRWSDKKFFSYKEMLDVIRTKYPSVARSPEEKNETSKSWHIPGHAGRIGFITSMSEHFCHTCNRLRITADGNLKVCLFGAMEVSLRDAMREGLTKEDLSLIISSAVQKKQAQHAGMQQLAQQKNRPMITIGG